MTDRPASWRMPTEKQMKKLAATVSVGRSVPGSPAVGPGDPMPPEYWQAVLDDASVDAKPIGAPVRTQRLGDIGRHLLRVACRPPNRMVRGF
ncbi:hypothetical protein [Bradyrhizobium sp. CCBAU 51627]|uniref:hypothetical protein n=1 Tax=Bradyrhizobium sp. CCBAU 51627 TaxID=1325088 RepID=UPI0023060703|nr:hypothetical protein [Bradyrhizobium sp. CCBAU 51627]